MNQVLVNQILMNPPLVTGAICFTGCGLLAWKALKSVHTRPIRDNPRLRILEGIKTGREYGLEMTQLMVDTATREATSASLRAKQARDDSVSALLLEITTRCQEQNAIHKAEEARKMENTILHSQQLHGNSESLDNQLLAAREAREQAEEWARVAQQTARDVASKAKAAQEAAHNAAEEAAEMARAANQAREDAEEYLRRGILPVVIPKKKEIADAKSNVKYQNGLFHFAVAGAAGCGKSSLINAIRGLENKHADAAGTGVIETTNAIGRYPDSNPKFVWYDIPGAGTLRQPDWLYFNTQGLFVFDCVVVLFDNRFSEIDIAVLTNCRRFQIPTYIVRSKADVHIRNLMYDDGYSSDHDDPIPRKAMYAAARRRLVADTRETVRRNLQEANLPNQRVYIVSSRTLMPIVKDRSLSYRMIDELELMKDMIEAACAHRCDFRPEV